ncbi:MAG: DUF1570 domain-containing protein [Pirellulaceae bacterium]|nr:DUF1570 domain-containing protein [Pirellulaceae bacterium]
MSLLGKGFWSWCLPSVLFAATALAVLPASAQPLRTVDPRAFGLDIPPGQVVPGGNRRVLTVDRQGEGVVGRVHVEVGQHRIVLLPDGQLVVRTAADCPLTDRPFEPLGMDQLAQQLTTGPLANFQTRQSRRYLYIYDTSDTFAVLTNRIMESMFPGVVVYAQSQRIEVQAPELPMVVIMFRTEEQFQQYQRMPPGVLAYYDPLSNHVVMFEEPTNKQLRPDLALQQGLSTIAHEGAHQILHNIGVQQRLSRWPMWIAEGLAEFFAPTTIDQRMRWKGAGQINDLRMFELEQYVQSRAAEEPRGDIVQHTVEAARLSSTGYATAWALTHYLAKNQRQQFHDYVRDVSRLGPLEGAVDVTPQGTVPGNLALFHKHFGQDAIDLERRLVLHLKKQPYQDPFADWPHYVGLAIVLEGKRERREARTFHTALLAEKWRRDLSQPEGQDDPNVRCEIRQFPNRALADRFARQWLRGE